MGFNISDAGQRLACLALSLAVSLQSGASAAQESSQGGLDKGQYIPTIWVDPDGCEHWVMDDGAEGFMTPHVNRNGIPVCRDGNICGVLNSDPFFASGSPEISASGRASLEEFFATTQARSFVITGHTDSQGSDASNMRLSLARANTVANVARSQGAVVSDIRGLGERQPKASNDTASGRAQNRRVEVTCVR